MTVLIRRPIPTVNVHARACTHQVDEGGGAALSSMDVGKTVEVENGELRVDGSVRGVVWADGEQQDCAGRIVSVEDTLKGAVVLDSGVSFDNPATTVMGRYFGDELGSIKVRE